MPSAAAQIIRQPLCPPCLFICQQGVHALQYICKNENLRQAEVCTYAVHAHAKLRADTGLWAELPSQNGAES